MAKLNTEFIHKGIKSIFDDVESLRKITKTNKEPYIRPSSALGCSIPHFVKIANGYKDSEEGEWESEDSFMFNYYTGVGTVTHEIFQHWFGHTGKLIGDWSCDCKGYKTVKKIIGRQEQEFIVPKVMVRMSARKPCPKCGKVMKYEELEVSVKGFTGHVDGVLEFEHNNKKYYVVIDYKGTTAEKIKNYKPGHPYIQFPDPKHVKQISIYAHALRVYYNLNIIGYAVLYTARDTPIPKYKICAKFMEPQDWKKAEDLFESQVKQIRVLYKTLDDLKVSRLLKHKLCKDHSFYKENVEGRFNQCEYCSICFSAPKQMTGILKDAAKHLAKK